MRLAGKPALRAGNRTRRVQQRTDLGELAKVAYMYQPTMIQI